MSGKAPFLDLDLGSSKPASVPTQEVEVVVTPGDILGDYARVFVREGWRKNHRVMEREQLTEDEVRKYCVFLIKMRVDCVKEVCSIYRKLKKLYIPDWLQFNLSMIGEVILRDIGLKLVPCFEGEVISLEEAVVISDKIGALEDDLAMHQDAMPRDSRGDPDVMSTALIAGYVRAIRPVQHVVSTYVTAFLGLMLRKEAAMSTLYRIQYDDIGFIAAALTAHRGLFS